MDETVQPPETVNAPKSYMRDDIAKTLIVAVLGFAMQTVVVRTYDKCIIDRRASKTPTD
jgi:hypothetical protein